MATSLSPDRLAALEEERDFLLRSLADLDAERAAGDIDDADHRALTDDYTARTAEVLRAIDEHREAVAAARPARSPARIGVLVGGVALVAVLAGVLVAQASGRREPGDTLTGDAPPTATAEARECIDLTSQQRVGEAVQCYQDVLDRDPDNPTALTYFGWTLILSSEQLPDAVRTDALRTARNLLDRAVEAAPDGADAYAFRAILNMRQDRVEDAAADLDQLDRLDPPASVEALIGDLRTDVEEAQRTTTTTVTTTP